MRNAQSTTKFSLIIKLSTKTQEALRSDAPGLEKYRQYLDQGHYRASDVGISYRALNAVDEAGLIPDYNILPRGKKWRSFTLREAVYLQTIFKLKAFGMTNAKLRGLLDFFESKKFTEDDVFLADGVDVPITVLIFSDGNGFVLDDETLADYDKENRVDPVIMFNLNRQIHDTMAQLGVDFTENGTKTKIRSMNE